MTAWLLRSVCFSLSAVLAVGLWLTAPLPAIAQPEPAALFELHCAGCHPGGGNIIRRGKTLKQRALKRYGYDEPAAIATIITQGKGIMSAFGDKLTEAEIQSLAQYVLDQAAINWKS
ncbi:MAG: cytochrome C6 [Leptolyngbya sp. SIO4C1]|nr:cytochrome C6 [Leptolyngbya sp. SIO4C1]